MLKGEDMAKKYDGYMLCTDMDGTLLNTDHEISKENAEAIKHFIREGGIFTVATGRIPPAVIPFLPTLPPTLRLLPTTGRPFMTSKAANIFLTYL